MRTQKELLLLLQLDIGPPQACCQTHVMGLLICWSLGGGGGVNQLVYAQTVGSADSDGQKEHFSSLQQNRGPLETNVNKN